MNKEIHKTPQPNSCCCDISYGFPIQLSDLILFFALQIELVLRFLCDITVAFMILHRCVTTQGHVSHQAAERAQIEGNIAQRHSFYTHRKWAEVARVQGCFCPHVNRIL